MSAFGSWLGILIGPFVLIFLGILLFMLIRELLRLSQDDDSPQFESNWGGLGRGLGGWRVNNMMVIMVFSLLILIMFGSVAYKLIPGAPAPNNSDGNKGSQNSSDTKAADAKSEPKSGTPETKPVEPKKESTSPAAGAGKE